jgi:hypothetical protein
MNRSPASTDLFGHSSEMPIPPNVSAKRVLIYPATQKSAVWLALEQLTGVEFQVYSSPEDFQKVDGAVIQSGDSRAMSMAAAAAVPFIQLAQAEPANGVTIKEVSFTSCPFLDSRLRGRQVSHEPVTLAPFAPAPGDVVLANSRGGPIWIKRLLSGTWMDILACPLPALRPGEHVVDVLRGGSFIQLLPVVHFLREVLGKTRWRPAPLRACFMFDDPNLHWPSYGYLSYPRLITLANQHDFHVALATVPLDGWFVHGPTAKLFRDHSERLTLLCHGNDHLRVELGRPREYEQTLQLLAQSIRRIEALERRAGIRVSRVMAPPHGACPPQVVQAMVELGLEAACVSCWSLRDWGGGHAWPPAFGLLPVEMISNRFPAIPRLPLDSSNLGTILVTAFLDRPIIPVGHHYSIADAPALLEDLANTINALGPVKWGSLESIARSSYQTKLEGDTLLVRPDAVACDIAVPDGVRAIAIWPGPQAPPGEEFRVYRGANGNGPPLRVPARCPFPVQSGERIRMIAGVLGRLDSRKVRGRFTGPWAPIRRALCEARDRVAPTLRRFKARPTAVVPNDVKMSRLARA